MTNPKSWRDAIAVHEAAELFPMMSEEELRALADDIKKHGLHEPVAILDGKLVDGRNRLSALELNGTKLVTGNGQPEWANIPFRNIKGADPVAYVVSNNVLRRHLSPEQKRELIEKLVKACPEKSDRQIAETVKASPTTVGTVRARMEAKGDVSKLDTRTDSKGRQQLAHKPTTRSKKRRRDIDDRLAEKLETSKAGNEPKSRTDIGPDSAGEANRLRARIDELQTEKRRIEIENGGLRGEIDDIKAARKPKPAGKGDKLSCSFCDKGHDKVSALVVGDGGHVAICNECIDLCVDIIAKHAAKKAALPTVEGVQ
jgi:ClpX C4-type zinc finger/ParB-like nuclease domain